MIVVQGLPFSFGYVGFGGFWFIAVISKHIFYFGVVFHTVSFDRRGIFTQRIADVLGGSSIV